LYARSPITYTAHNISDESPLNSNLETSVLDYLSCANGKMRPEFVTFPTKRNPRSSSSKRRRAVVHGAAEPLPQSLSVKMPDTAKNPAGMLLEEGNISI
jgi:hypothetical protein